MRRAFQPVVLALAAVVALLFMAAPGEAQARWLRAESTHFVIYSDGDEAGLRDYARRLEIFDAVLRRGMGVAADAPTYRKLPIHLVGGQPSLRQVRPGSRAAGFYAANVQSIFAIGQRSRDADFILFHEYAHHFMSQHSGGLVPPWYREGFAEYFMTIDIEGNRVTIGAPEPGRGAILRNAQWLPWRDVLAGNTAEFSLEIGQFYAQSWLLTHWMLSDPQRSEQLLAYLAAVREGGDPVTSLEQLLGMSVDQLDRTLREYARGALPTVIGESNLQTTTLDVTELPAVYDDLLLTSLAVGLGHDEDGRAAILRAARDGAGRHPADAFARLTLARAELNFGDLQTGAGILEQLVADRPDDAEALLFLGYARNFQARRATERPDQVRLLNESNGFLARAMAIDPQDFRIYQQLAENRIGAATYPTANDLQLRLMAFERAPQVVGVNLGLGEALMQAGRFDEAQRVLGPLANSPHRGPLSDRAAELVALARAGQPPTPRSPAN